MEQHNLGWIELHLGDVDAAEAWFDARDASAQPDAYSDAWQELNRAGVAAARTDWAQAREHFARGSTALQALGVELDPDDAFEREWLERQLAERAC